MSPSVITRQDGCAGRITLNRSNARHTLNRETCDAITKALEEWEENCAIQLILIDHAEGTRGFCAGTDLDLLASGDEISLAYLQAVYRLFQKISSYPKHCLVVMDGAAFGHGLGLSISARYRVATERTLISFPETGYGAIPDGGATRFLSQLPGEYGAWLALTGSAIGGQDTLAPQLATHYCACKDLSELSRALTEDGIIALKDYEIHADTHSIQHMEEIQRYFKGNCLKSIRRGLSRGGDWALVQARKMESKSPLSSSITLRLLRTGRVLDSVETALKIEYRILARLVESRNFKEGVRAKYSDMDHCPKWRPASLNRVTKDMVNGYFSPLPSNELRFHPRRQLVQKTERQGPLSPLQSPKGIGWLEPQPRMINCND